MSGAGIPHGHGCQVNVATSSSSSRSQTPPPPQVTALAARLEGEAWEVTAQLAVLCAALLDALLPVQRGSAHVSGSILCGLGVAQDHTIPLPLTDPITSLCIQCSPPHAGERGSLPLFQKPVTELLFFSVITPNVGSSTFGSKDNSSRTKEMCGSFFRCLGRPGNLAPEVSDQFAGYPPPRLPRRGLGQKQSHFEKSQSVSPPGDGGSKCGFSGWGRCQRIPGGQLGWLTTFD